MESKKRNIIRLTESQIREMVAESVVRVLNEGEVDELWNPFNKEDRTKAKERAKAIFNGAKQGYNYQKAMDRGTDGFKTEHDYWDAKKISNPFGKGPENTAAEQANQLLAQAKQYMAMANKLKAQANALTKQYSLQKTGVKCPKCGGDIVQRKSKYGKIFYGCNKYPNCDFVLWYEPVNEQCPKCKSILVKKVLKKGTTIQCSNKDCDFSKNIENTGGE